MTMHAIEITGVSHRFADGTIGLRNIDLTIPRGELVLIAGKNGSGKSTLLMHINGLIPLQSGRIDVLGIRVDRNPAAARQAARLVFQNADAQIVGETVWDDVAFGPENLRLDQKSIRRRVSDALQTVGLTEKADKRPHLLSGGEKRRLAIAGVLAMAPGIIMFDEPFSGLDYPGTMDVLACIKALHRSGKTILITSHDIEKAICIADRLVILDRGTVAVDGRPSAHLKDLEPHGVREPCFSRFGMPMMDWLQ